MRFFNGRNLSCSAAILAATSAFCLDLPAASADGYILTFQGMGPRRFIDWTFNSVSDTARGGVFNWEEGVKTFCTQLQEDLVQGGSVDYTMVDVEFVPDEPPLPGPMGVSRAIVLKDLYARWYSTVMEMEGTEARNYAAAFQMNIWEITHQSGNDSSAETVLQSLSFSQGNATFTSSNSVDVLANTMLNSLGEGGVFMPFDSLRGLTSELKQDQLIVIPGASGLAFGMGLIGVRRRRRR